MKRPIFTLVLYILVIVVLLCPFFLPEEWIYIKHNESIIHPVANTWMQISLVIIAFFFGYGVISLINNILED